MWDGFSVPVLSHAFNRQVDTVPSEVKPMLKDQDYKAMLTRWGAASDSDWLALADAPDMEEPIQPKVDEQVQKQKRRRIAATHPAQYGDMADALAGIVPQSDAPALLALESLAPHPGHGELGKDGEEEGDLMDELLDDLCKKHKVPPPVPVQTSGASSSSSGAAPAVEDTAHAETLSGPDVTSSAAHADVGSTHAADSCDAPALLAMEGSPTAVDDPETQPPIHTPVPAAQEHMAKTGATPAPLPLPSPPSPKAMFASSSSSSTAECSALAVPPPPLPHTPPAVALHVF